jgi:hypothetical protein
MDLTICHGKPCSRGLRYPIGNAELQRLLEDNIERLGGAVLGDFYQLSYHLTCFHARLRRHACGHIARDVPANPP